MSTMANDPTDLRNGALLRVFSCGVIVSNLGSAAFTLLLGWVLLEFATGALWSVSRPLGAGAVVLAVAAVVAGELTLFVSARATMRWTRSHAAPTGGVVAVVILMLATGLNAGALTASGEGVALDAGAILVGAAALVAVASGAVIAGSSPGGGRDRRAGAAPPHD
jgi:hypothetical protein